MKKLIVTDIKVPLSSFKSNAEFDAYAIRQAQKKLNGAGASAFAVYKRSLDMRKRDDAAFVYSVSAEAHGNIPNIKGVTAYKGEELSVLPKSKKRVCVVGFGPCGMFASLLLSEYGFEPVVYERGASVDERVALTERFINGGVLDTETNVQFGAGGAGTFSDGKLNTRINDPLCDRVLQTLVKFGAPSSVLTSAKPHVGTDILRNVVKGISAQVCENGGTVHYNTRVTDIKEENGCITVVTSNGQSSQFDAVILAIGHSARDTYGMLMQRGFQVVPKAYSVGVRAEHLQTDINEALYGNLCDKYGDILPVGEYSLSDKKAGNRGVYTFCMCPGGVVVPSSSGNDEICTNGMSYSARNGKYANSAVCVSVFPQDYGDTPVGAIEFQHNLEKLAFKKAGGDYSAPVTTVGDLLYGQGYHGLRYTPSYMNGKYTLCDIGEIFPEYITNALKEGLVSFGRRLKGFDAPYVPLTGVETRTSSPVRIMRGENMQSTTMKGVYPCGEGAGYAGGITSAAIDGLRAAKAIMEA